MKTLFNETELPVKELEHLGLYAGGALKLDGMDLAALLAGRRTDFITLTDLKSDGFRVEKLDAKLSLERAGDGQLHLRLHPIHKVIRGHDLLSEGQKSSLVSAELAAVLVERTGRHGKDGLLAVEYDAGTREFISYDPALVKAPERVNGFDLDARQKRDYSNGLVITLGDGTRIQHRAAERAGITADNLRLILSVRTDEGLSYVLVNDVKALIAQPELNRPYFTQAYSEALKELNHQAAGKERGLDQGNEYERSLVSESQGRSR